MKVSKNLYELLTGKTSINISTLGFDVNGAIVNTNYGSEAFVLQNSKRTVTLLDIGGNQKYRKTVLKGVGLQPDYVMIVVDSVKGVSA